ncbi:MAG TPA: hypothetical protein VH877_22500, partial [Polyangia bacterium]|nr:hypothetical protein [Polyangia bacterium]
MNRTEVHRCWCLPESPWSRWVKPVLFAYLDEELEPGPLPPSPGWLLPEVIRPLEMASQTEGGPTPYRAAHRLRDVALVIDLPGAEGTQMGIGLAEKGFRPIPLYNAVPAPGATIDVRPIMAALVNGAGLVGDVAGDAPPAFLLDADRMGQGRAVQAGDFDNRSVCTAADFPSAALLGTAGIRRVV